MTYTRNSQDTANRPLFDAVCAKCGEACKVPFKPTGEKPVYCSNCFDEMRQSSPRTEQRRYPERRPDNNGNDRQYKELFSNLDIKLDKIISLLTLISEKKTVRVSKKAQEAS